MDMAKPIGSTSLCLEITNTVVFSDIHIKFIKRNPKQKTFQQKTESTE